MPLPSILYDPDFMDDRIYQGIWQRYHGSRYASKVLTLTTYRALFVLAALVIIVEYTGSRFWVILRYAIFRAVRTRGTLPIQLSTASRSLGFSSPCNFDAASNMEQRNAIDHTERLLQISRTRAIMNTFSAVERIVLWLSRRCRRSATHEPTKHQYDPGQSAWFGFGALLCSLMFVAGGAAVPYLIAEGTFGAPIVRSRVMEDCMNSTTTEGTRVDIHLDSVGVIGETDSIFRRCGERTERKCLDKYYFVRPKVSRRRSNSCPFAQTVCDPRFQALELTHWNISAFELGMNSPSKLVVNHRTTCAPVFTSQFMWRHNVSNITYLIAGKMPVTQNFVFPLLTANGPNARSNHPSGPEYVDLGGLSDLRVLPNHLGTIVVDSSIWDGWEGVHELLARDDAASYLVVYRAGRMAYGVPVNDPLFGAHQKRTSTRYDGQETTFYHPDYEATTLACMDQLQACIPGMDQHQSCSPWQRHGNFLSLMNDIAHQESLSSTQHDWLSTAITDAFTYLPLATPSMTVHFALASRHLIFPRSNLLRDVFTDTRLSLRDEEWILEVETWFMKAIMDTVLSMRLGARWNRANFSSPAGLVLKEHFGAGIVDEWPTCGKVLVRDSNFTNINWYGLCAILSSMAFVCLVSFCVETKLQLQDLLVQSLKSIGYALENARSSLLKLRLRGFASIVNFLNISTLLRSIPVLQIVSTSWRIWPRAGTHSRTADRASAAQPNAVGAAAAPRNGTHNTEMNDLQRAEEVDNPV